MKSLIFTLCILFGFQASASEAVEGLLGALLECQENQSEGKCSKLGVEQGRIFMKRGSDCEDEVALRDMAKILHTIADEHHTYGTNPRAFANGFESTIKYPQCRESQDPDSRHK